MDISLANLPTDIIGEFVARIPKGSWQPFVMTCKAFNQWNTREEIIKRANHLWTLCKMFPHADWDSSEVYSNPNTTLDILEEIPKYLWDKSAIMRNPNITESFIMTYDLIGFCEWDELVLNKNISPEFILTHGRRNNALCNPNTNLEDLEIYKYQPYCSNNIMYTSSLSCLTEEFIITHAGDFAKDRSLIAKHPIVTFETYKKCPEIVNYTCGLYHFSQNKNITFDIVFANPDINWDPIGLSRNPNLTIDVVLSHPDIRWKRDHIVKNLAIPIQSIINTNIFDLDKMATLRLSTRRDLSLKIIRDNPHIDWEMRSFMANGRLTFFDVIENPDIEWYFEDISENKFGRI